MSTSNSLDTKIINTIRFLSADAVQKANSGHPGLPMGTAAIAYTLWSRHLKFNPANPKWFNRDRFILSGGHGSMLLYSLLHLFGYDLSLEEIKQFRQLGSKTPGHPEFGHTPGVETTTGPLGQGFANGVGMAIAESHLAALYNQKDHSIIDHYTYALVTDGDLMEGISSEAASLAGHLQLGKMIYFYDDNRISIDGSTDLSFTEDRAKRFLAFNWQVLEVENGNDVDEIDRAIQEAKKSPKPSLIICRTHIGFGLPKLQDTSKAHGSPPGEEELLAARKNLNWEYPEFVIPDDVKDSLSEYKGKGLKLEEAWNSEFAKYTTAFPELSRDLNDRINQETISINKNWLPEFPADKKGMATRSSSGKTLNAVFEHFDHLMGGSADLTPSNNTWLDKSTAYQSDNPQGKYIHYGVREHAMGAIMNGIAYHGGIVPYGATFLVFSDYVRPAIRLSALSKLQTIWVFTHDSIGVGEDGPTHQPVEHISALRAIPGLTVIRPGDANETAFAWKSAFEQTDGPTLLVLSRQNMPTYDRNIFTSAESTLKGAYILKDFGENPEIILMASGSELHLVVEGAEKLHKDGIQVRVVSFPSWELFEQQPKEYRDSVLPKQIKKRLSIEAGISMGWEKYVEDEGTIIGIDHFGASAPGNLLMEKFGFTVENVVEKAKELLKG